MFAETDQMIHTEVKSRAINWRQVGAFLGLTFGLTWLLNLAIYLRGGLEAPGVLTVLQLQMLLPAFSAILLGMFFFPDSPIYYRKDAGRGRWFYYFFLVLTAVYTIGALAAWFAPGDSTILAVSAVTQILAILGVVFLVVLRFIAGREAMARVWLSWGSWRYWLIFGIAIAAYYVLQVVLNAVTGLSGSTIALPTALPTIPGMDANAFFVLALVQSVLVGPFIGIVIAFGEEYGWRGYLQNELFKMGRLRGVLLLGVIWGAWHWPLILMGYNFPGQPLLGVLLMTLYTIGLAVVLGYVVLKSGSVLLASYLHALNNQVLSFLFVMGFEPYDRVLSFGIGIYGAITLAVACFLILRDPIWRGTGGTLPE